MKKIVRFLFISYHLIFASPNAICRFRPTCSEYALKSIEKHGVYGIWMSLKRVASCHPFSKRPIYDPV